MAETPAFEKLKIKGTADAIFDLVKLTEHADARISAAACAELGRMKSVSLPEILSAS